jgi:hypothetical protein
MSGRFFPFHDLGLQANPFRTLTQEEWVAVTVLPRPIRQILTVEIGHLQFRGQKGCGKTTTLYTIEARMRQAGQRVAYERVAEGVDCFSTPLDGLAFFLLDEAQRLSRSERRRLMAAAGHVRLGLGNHADFTGDFGKRGLSLVTVDLEAIVFEELATILARRLAYFSMTERPRYSFAASAVDYLTNRYSPYLRAAELFLYEYFQQLPPAGEISGEQLRSFAATSGY